MPDALDRYAVMGVSHSATTGRDHPRLAQAARPAHSHPPNAERRTQQRPRRSLMSNFTGCWPPSPSLRDPDWHVRGERGHLVLESCCP